MDTKTLDDILNEEQFELPPVQRGFVWKPYQVELLWDSVLRGFPIGSFIVMPSNGGYFLVDGQQRFVSLALADVKPGIGVQKMGNEIPICLWLDLAGPPKSDSYHRKFCFRVVTKAHPWGFQKAKPERKLIPTQCGEAWEAMGGNNDSTKITEDIWKKAFPWDAKFPVPFHIFYNKRDFPSDPKQFYEYVLSLPYNSGEHWIERLGAATIDDVGNQLESLRNAIKNINGLEIPLLKIPEEDRGKPSNGQDKTKKDHMNKRDENDGEDEPDKNDSLETCFLRFNRGGTMIAGEELIYSLLKSKCEGIKDTVDNSAHDLKLVSAPRIVLLSAQLFDNKNKRDAEKPARAPRVRQFRRMMEDPEKRGYFVKHLQELLPSQFLSVRNLLCGAGEKPESWRLPPYIAASIAQSRHLMFLLLWKIANGEISLDIDEKLQKYALGTVTYIHWFARSSQGRSRDRSVREIVDTIWQKPICRWRDEIPKLDHSILIPPIKPSCVERAFVEWGKASTEEWESRYRNSKYHDFYEKMFYQKEMILYAQRDALRNWFPDYDPTMPGRIEQVYRPWDYDHIIPSSFTYRKQKRSNEIFELSWIVGNFRALPYSKNRSRQGDPMISTNELADSFMSDEWAALLGKLKGMSVVEKKKEELVRFCRKAILNRTLNIYREWYDKLIEPR